MSWIELLQRVFISFFVLLIMARLMGKKQLSHLTFFHYVTGITIGSITASLSVDSSIEIKYGTVCIIIWSALTVLLDYITLKSQRARVVIVGQPTILIKDGKINEYTLSRTRINMDDLTMMLRNNNIFDIKEVDYAILEPNGQVSVLKKAIFQNIAKQDLITDIESKKNLATQIINHRKLISKNLKELNLDEKWLKQEIKKQGYKNIRDIFYAEISSNGKLYIMPVGKGKDRKFK